MYTTMQDMAESATATPPANSFIAPAPAPAPARAPARPLRSLRDVEAAISEIQWPAGHVMQRRVTVTQSYSVTVHLSQQEQRAAARWDRIIGIVCTVLIGAVLAKLCL
jgi:hypothetical protein